MRPFARAARFGAAFLFLAASAALAPVSAADLTLRITLQLPMKSHLGQNLLLFKERVEALSNNSINVEIYDSAQLYKDKEVPEAVGSGQIEMGVASLTRYVGEIPAVDVFYMPFLLNTEEKVRAAVAPGSEVRGLIDGAIAETGSKVLWWQAYGTVILLSNDAPVATPDDMKGKKARVFGKTLGEWVKTVGGVPTLISGSEQFLAYQRGTVDIGMTGVSGVQARSLWDVMDTITKVNVADIEFIVLINEDFWNGLTEEQQGWINEAALDAEKNVRDRVSEIEATAYAEAEKNGMTGVSGVQARSLWDVMDTITKVNVADIEFIVLINEDFWNGLTKEQQGWINEAALDAEKNVRDRVSEIEATAYAEAEKNGMTIYQPTDAEIESWKTASHPVIDEWLKSAGELGKKVHDAASKL